VRIKHDHANHGAAFTGQEPEGAMGEYVNGMGKTPPGKAKKGRWGPEKKWPP